MMLFIIIWLTILFLCFRWVQPAFDKNQIRLVIFRDNDRSVIFDSKAVHKVEPQEQVS